MKTFKTGESVNYGLYVSMKGLDARFVGADNETLEGKPNANYVRMPTALMIAAAPILGGVFVVAFPVLVLLMAAGAVVKLIMSVVTDLLQSRAHLMQMQWEPTAAYLNKDGKKKASEEKNEDLKELDKEVQARRNDEK